MKKTKFIITTLLVMFFGVINVNASNVPLKVYSLSYRNLNLLENKSIYVPAGNSNINFDISIDSDAWTKVSLVLCMDGTHSGGIIPNEYKNYIRNINHVATDYSCMYANSSYKGGRVHSINFEILPQGEFNGYFTIYNATVSIQLIDFIADSSSFVDLTKYSSQTLIDQNSSIINNQNAIINGQNNLINGQNNIHDRIQDTNLNLKEQNKKLDDLNNNLTSSDIDTSGVGGFFNDFSNEDNGGISGVVTAPLRFIRKMSNTCKPLYMDVLGADVELPCGTTLFWDKPEVNTFKVFWNTLVGGFLSYLLLRKLFKTIDDLKDPNNSRVDVMKL